MCKNFLFQKFKNFLSRKCKNCFFRKFKNFLFRKCKNFLFRTCKNFLFRMCKNFLFRKYKNFLFRKYKNFLFRKYKNFLFRKCKNFLFSRVQKLSFSTETIKLCHQDGNNSNTFTLEIPEKFYDTNFSHHHSNINKNKPPKRPNSKNNQAAKIKKFTDLLTSDFQPENAHLPPFSPGSAPESRLKKLADNVANKNITITVSEYDAIRDDGILFYQRMEKYGARLVINPGCGHIFMYFAPQTMQKSFQFPQYYESMRQLLDSLEYR